MRLVVQYLCFLIGLFHLIFIRSRDRQLFFSGFNGYSVLLLMQLLLPLYCVPRPFPEHDFFQVLHTNSLGSLILLTREKYNSWRYRQLCRGLYRDYIGATSIKGLHRMDLYQGPIRLGLVPSTRNVTLAVHRRYGYPGLRKLGLVPCTRNVTLAVHRTDGYLGPARLGLDPCTRRVTFAVYRMEDGYVSTRLGLIPYIRNVTFSVRRLNRYLGPILLHLVPYTRNVTLTVCRLNGYLGPIRLGLVGRKSFFLFFFFISFSSHFGFF